MFLKWKKKVLFNIAIEYVELKHEFRPKHLHMGIKYDEEAE